MEMKLRGEYRQLTFVRASQATVNTDEVAQVNKFGKGKTFVAHLAFADEDLDIASPVA
jgi:hypothetical protein